MLRKAANLCFRSLFIFLSVVIKGKQTATEAKADDHSVQQKVTQIATVACKKNYISIDAVYVYFRKLWRVKVSGYVSMSVCPY